jgi:RNA polymerase sigma-70 factor, ECF subfamily
MELQIALPELTQMARRLCRSNIDPDDLVQDVLEKTLRSPVPEGANVRAWLSRVMRNLFIDKLRRDRSRREDLTAEPTAASPTDEPPAWWELLSEEEVRAVLARVPADQRITFELFAFEGKSYDEIAATLDIAKATVGTRILRTRQRLRSLLGACQPA